MLRQDNMVVWEGNRTWVNMVYTMDFRMQPLANSCVATGHSHD